MANEKRTLFSLENELVEKKRGKRSRLERVKWLRELRISNRFPFSLSFFPLQGKVVLSKEFLS